MAFATPDDIAIRLGRSLTEAEAAMAEQVIEGVTDQIAAAAGEDADWTAELDPVPGVLKTLCIEKVIAVGSNPNGLASESETLGAWTLSKAFSRNAAGLFLTEAERRTVRKAIRGTFLAVSLESPYSGDDEIVNDLPL